MIWTRVAVQSLALALLLACASGCELILLAVVANVPRDLGPEDHIIAAGGSKALVGRWDPPPVVYHPLSVPQRKHYRFAIWDSATNDSRLLDLPDISLAMPPVMSDRWLLWVYNPPADPLAQLESISIDAVVRITDLTTLETQDVRPIYDDPRTSRIRQLKGVSEGWIVFESLGSFMAIDRSTGETHTVRLDPSWSVLDGNSLIGIAPTAVDVPPPPVNDGVNRSVAYGAFEHDLRASTLRPIGGVRLASDADSFVYGASWLVWSSRDLESERRLVEGIHSDTGEWRSFVSVNPPPPYHSFEVTGVFSAGVVVLWTTLDGLERGRASVFYVDGREQVLYDAVRTGLGDIALWSRPAVVGEFVAWQDVTSKRGRRLDLATGQISSASLFPK